MLRLLRVAERWCVVWEHYRIIPILFTLVVEDTAATRGFVVQHYHVHVAMTSS